MTDSQVSPDERPVRRVQRSSPRRQVAAFAGEPAAIYCRISHVLDDDQTGVDRQERLCRETAQRLGLVVAPEHVYIDNNRSAWKRDRKRPGWDAMLSAMRGGVFRHVVAYHPDRLMRQPHDLEDLLQIADESQVMLHGQANRRDLSNADDRFFLRIEVAHACKSSDDTSRRIRDKMEEKAENGDPSTGKRVYGYTPDGRSIIEDEAKVIRWIIERYLAGDGPALIAKRLNEKGLPTSLGKTWADRTVRRVLDSRHAAGIKVFRGEEIGPGNWPVIIDAGTWEEIRERRTYRAARHVETTQAPRFYLLRGLIVCGRCGVRMSGAATSREAAYVCNRSVRRDTLKCVRRIHAAKVDEFVTDAAIDLLTNLTIGPQAPATGTTDAAREAMEEDRRQLAELNEMWTAKQVTTSEYLAMKKAINDRIAAAQKKTVVRPVGTIADLIGPDAPAKWAQLTEERKNATLRFLFNAVVIGESTTPRGVFDYGRIDIQPNQLT